MADPSASTPFGTAGYQPEYQVPFAKQLPPEGFTTDWVDWGPVPCECMVFPRSGGNQFAQIQSVDSFGYVDDQGQADPDASQVFPQPQKVLKGPYKVQFEVEPYKTDSARSLAKDALRDRNGVFILKAKLKAALLFQGMTVGSAGFGGVGSLIGGKSVPAFGKARLKLEPPKPVIWSDGTDIANGQKRVTVDTSKDEGTEFPADYYVYDAGSQKYQPTNEVLDVAVSCDFPVTFTVESLPGKIRVKSSRVIVGNKMPDDSGSMFKDTPVGEVTISRKTGATGGPPLNDSLKIPVYYKPIPSAKLQVRVLAKQCFACGASIPQKQEVCGSCSAPAIRGKLEPDISDEKFELQFPNLPPQASGYLYYVWKIILPAGTRPSPSFQTEDKCEEFGESGDGAP